MNSYLAIVSRGDEPIYTAEFFRNDFTTEKLVEQRSLNDFIIHSALDMIDKVWMQSNSYYMPIVDRYERWMVSAFKTGSGRKRLNFYINFYKFEFLALIFINLKFCFLGDVLVLLHDVKNDDAIKNFFIDLHELYTKVSRENGKIIIFHYSYYFNNLDIN